MEITAVVVSYNTKELLQKSLKSVIDHYPGLRIIVVDGSDKNNPCYEYVKGLNEPNILTVQPGHNIGHGRGMAMGIAMAETDKVLIFDSDIEMKKAPIEKMLEMFEPDTFGVGEIVDVSQSTYGVKISDGSDVPCLHPYFHIISKKQYSQYLPYIHSGGPTALTAIDIYRRGLSKKVLKSFPVRDYIKHDWRGTRDLEPEDFKKFVNISDYFPREVSSLITVVMIDSRSDQHPDWVQTAINSVKKQTYPVKMLVVDNIGRKKTIGQCWNEAVKHVNTPWTFFLGDDDWISPDLCGLFAYYIQRPDLQQAVSFTTNMTVYREEGQETRTKELPRPHTGCWKTEYLRKYPFNEKLQKGIDREYIEEVEKRGDTKILIHYHAGYHYRQHDDYSCAGKISLKPQSGEIYVNSRYPIHVSAITERLKKHYSITLDNHPFDPLSTSGAKLWFCDWGNENAVAMGNFETNVPKILRVHAYEVFTQLLHHIPFDRYDRVIFVAEHIKEYAERQLNRKLEHAVVIPNGVDLNAFYPPADKERNNKIAYAGELSRKKGLQLMLFIAEHFPEYDFHVAGKFNEPDMAEYFMQRKPDNVFLEPYSYDLNEFFKDKTYFLLTSPREGCNVTALQAMAAGLHPLVYHHIGASDLLKEISPFCTIEQLNTRLRTMYVSPGYCREIVEHYYNIETIFPQYLEIIEDLLDGNIESRNIKEGAAAG